MKGKEISNEQLNRFIDGELDPAVETELRELLQNDPVLRERLEQFRRVRTLVRYAFTNTIDDVNSSNQPKIAMSAAQKAIAASVMLAIGLVLGWFMHGQIAYSPTKMYINQNSLAIKPLKTVNKVSKETRIMLHISNADPRTFNTALIGADRLLTHYKKQNKPLTLEILVNSDALQLVQANNIFFRDRVLALQGRYSNVSFLACGITVRKRGKPKLLPGVVIVPSAREQIITRLKEGWGYIQT